MLADVCREIDAVLCFTNAGEGRIGGDGDWRDEGDDAPVVARVGACVEHVRTRHAGDGVTNGVDDLGAPALGEIGYTLDELHGRTV